MDKNCPKGTDPIKNTINKKQPKEKKNGYYIKRYTRPF